MKQETSKQHVELINDNIEEFDKAIKLFKQETLEEAAKNYAEEYKGEEQAPWFDFIEGAKWQQEKSYSEEDIKLAFEEGFNVYRCVTDNANEAKECFNEWFNRFKNK